MKRQNTYIRYHVRLIQLTVTNTIQRARVSSKRSNDHFKIDLEIYMLLTNDSHITIRTCIGM